MRLSEAVEIWLSQYTNQHSYSTNFSSLDPFVRATGPNLDVTEVTPALVQRYVDDLQKRASKHAHQRKVHRKALSVPTQRKDIKAIKSFFKFLVKEAILEYSPADDIPLPQLALKLNPSEQLTNEEVEIMLQVAYGNQLHYTLLCWLIGTTCRVGETAGLTIADLSIEQRWAIVYRQDSSRVVQFGDTCASELCRWLAVRPIIDHDYVFCSPHTPYQPYQPASLSKIIRKVGQKAGIKRPIHTGDLRHYQHPSDCFG